jgi:integrase
MIMNERQGPIRCPRRAISNEDLAVLLAHADGPFKAVLTFLRSTGCRASELCELRWQDVDLARGVVLLTANKMKTAPRVVPIGQEGMNLLKKLLDESPPPGHVFRDGRGAPWDRRTLAARLHRLREQTGISHQATLLGIRYRWCEEAIRQGLPLITVALIMGYRWRSS